jgi:hypothetical protein
MKPHFNHEENVLNDFFLAISLIFFISALLYFNNYSYSYECYKFIVAPLALLPMEIKEIKGTHLISRDCFDFSFKYLRRTGLAFHSIILWLAIIYMICIVLSSSIYPMPSLSWFFIFSTYFFYIILYLAIIVRLFIFNMDLLEMLLSVLTLLCSFMLLVNVAAYLPTLPNFLSFPSYRFAPTIGYVPDHFPTTSAMTYSIIFVISFNLALTSKSVLTRLLYVMCCLILFSGIILTQSRGPLIGTIASLMIISFDFLWVGRLSMLVVFALIGFLVNYSYQIGGGFLYRGLSSRLDVFDKFIQLFLDRPIFGYGERITLAVEIIFGHEKLGHAHNLLLSSAIRGGVGSLLALFFIFFLSLIVTIKYKRLSNNNLPLCLITTLLVSSLVDYDLLVFLPDWQWVSIWLPIGLAVGCDLYVSGVRKNIIFKSKLN